MILVLIPHYNDLKGLYKSIASVYHKETIHILVIDDGSSKDHLPKIDALQKLANDRVTIILETLNKNTGITNALNHGLQIALKNKEYKFIARLDCGDICVKNRFSVQKDFLDNNLDISLIGSWVKFIDEEEDELFSFKPPVEHEKILKKMSVRCNFIHPSIMLRKSVVEELGMYPEEYEAAEDYAYFYKISNEYKTANINKFLTQVTVNPDGISNKKRVIQNKNKIRIIKKNSPKNLHFVYGMLFNYGLLLAPNRMVSKVKKIVMK